MYTTRSIVPCSCASPFGASCSRSCQVSSVNPTSKQIYRCHFLGNHKLLQFSSFRIELNQPKMDMAVYGSIDPAPPLPSSNPFPDSWKGWIVGILISVILPFWRNKWSPIRVLKDKVEAVVETADMVAEIVEEVAEGVEKVADEVADHLPEGGKLKETVTLVEKVAKETAKSAGLADDFIDKVEDVVEDAESLIEPATGDANQKNKEAKH